MVDDLKAKYNEISGNFQSYLDEAEQNKNELENDLGALKSRIEDKKNQNE